MKNNNQGFTLTEMVVAFVVLAILSSIGVVGVLAYQDFADFERQNRYAQTLFVAAQAELTADSVRGGLEELQEAPGEALQLDTIITGSGGYADVSGQGEIIKGDTIYALTGTAETYQKYKNGEYDGRDDDESKGYRALYGMFEEYLTDQSLLNAAISLEYNPQKGLVYGVLYSDRNQSFTYTATNRDGRVNICDRREDYRNEYLVGYYGLE